MPNRAVLWKDGKAYDLNALLIGPHQGVHLETAYGISASGQIVAAAGNGNAYLLTPVKR